jgi:hypothetical protein
MREQGTEEIIHAYRNVVQKLKVKIFFGHKSVISRLIQGVILYREYISILFLGTAAFLHRKPASHGNIP